MGTTSLSHPPFEQVRMAMKVILTMLFLLQISIASGMERPKTSNSAMMEMHEQWIAKHGRVYKNDLEKAERFEIFKRNVEYINSINANGLSYKLAANKFADLTNEEFRVSMNGYRDAGLHKVLAYDHGNLSLGDVPLSKDWRALGAVTPVKDQEICASCWAFSAVAAVEGVNQIKTGSLISLSEQEIIDCDRQNVDRGCNGGVITSAFEYIEKNGGLSAESNYPYIGRESGTCNNQISSNAASITGYINLQGNNEQAMMNAVANQPISTAIDASGDAFRFYSSGVFTGPCGINIDHAVALVGYGATSRGTPYWIVKNSWGTSWGDDGYILMERNIGAPNGLCGIAMVPSVPIA